MSWSLARVDHKDLKLIIKNKVSFFSFLCVCVSHTPNIVFYTLKIDWDRKVNQRQYFHKIIKWRYILNKCCVTFFATTQHDTYIPTPDGIINVINIHHIHFRIFCDDTLHISNINIGHISNFTFPKFQLKYILFVFGWQIAFSPHTNTKNSHTTRQWSSNGIILPPSGLQTPHEMPHNINEEWRKYSPEIDRKTDICIK